MSDRCRSCGAEIVWAKVAGKTIPLNKRRVRVYREDEHGDIVEEHTFATHGDKEVIVPTLRHISHFITCPNASSHSKART